jgi:hypothetical protein
MHYYYKQFKNKLAAMSWEQLEAMFEQYSEMQSRSVGDELKLEMIAIELDTREADDDDFERVRYDVYEY